MSRVTRSYLPGKTLNQNVRAMDLVARYGGEEMTIIMPGADVKQPTAVAERIRRQVSNIDFDGFFRDRKYWNRSHMHRLNDARKYDC